MHETLDHSCIATFAAPASHIASDEAGASSRAERELAGRNGRNNSQPHLGWRLAIHGRPRASTIECVSCVGSTPAKTCAGL